MKKFFLGLCLCLPALVGADTLKPLIVGSLSYNPPFELEADSKGNIFGFDASIMNEICKRIQRSCKYKLLPFSALFVETLSGDIDVSIASITITEGRQTEFIFSLPYLMSAAHFVAIGTSPLKSINDIQGKKIGILEGSVYLSDVLERFKGANQIVQFSKESDELAALQSGRLDLVITDDAIAEYWVANTNGELKLVGKAIRMGEGYGIMANKQHAALIEQINAALEAMESDGTYLKIYNTYF